MSASSKPTSKRQTQVLVGLGVVLAAILIFQVLPMMTGGDAQPPDAGSSKASDRAAARAAGASGARDAAPGSPASRAAAARAEQGPVEDVQLAKLEQQWPAPGESRRNPFTMTAAPPLPSETTASAAATAKAPEAPVVPVATGPPPPPPIPPITLKFIGVISSDTSGRIAGLSDGKFVYRGREGQVIEGRYRIVKIGEESIQLEYVNGTGRQTIRLSGK